MKTQNNHIGRFEITRGRFPVLHSAILMSVLVSLGSSAASFRVLHHFRSGMSPQGTVAVGGDVIYGTTYRVNSNGYGTVYRINMDGSEFAILKEFAGNDGSFPQAGLVLSGSTLFGTTTRGGAFGGGTIFKMQTDGSGFEVLKSFDPEAGEGSWPSGSEALLLSGTTLYGMTQSSGVSNHVSLGWGTVFSLQTDGTGFKGLHHFSGGDESYPWSGLAMEGATLYGTTSGWATQNRGAIFKIGADGSGYVCLKRFTGGADAAFPLGGVVVAGDTLFGTTYYGAGSKYPGGTVFRMKTDGTGYTIINSNLSCPRGGIVLSNGVLYGTTIYGGVSNYGSVYALTTNAAHTLLKGFTGPDGRTPWGSLALSGRMIFGTTLAGGDFDGGVLFALPTPAPHIVSSPVSQTAEVGSTVRFSVVVEGEPPMHYQLLANETNVVAFGTIASLILTDLKLAQSGNYRVLVTNVYGNSFSANAELNVIPPVDRRPVPEINLVGETESILTLDYANELTTTPDWQLLATVSLIGTSAVYFDVTTPSPPQRFYRAWQARSPGVSPTLSLPFMVPAVTLTGDPGDQVRVDGINQFGSTDAWFTLDTVTLTNNSQLYFDVTAPRQPARLYRLVPVP